MINFVKKVSKAIAGVAGTIISMPILHTILLDSPIVWTIPIGTAIIVGVTIYAAPRNAPSKP